MVSTAMLGPCQLKKKDTRLAIDEGLLTSPMDLPRACA